MKKTLLAVLLLSTGPGIAGTAGVNSGSSMTTGPSSSALSLQSATHNPAMTSLVVPDKERWRISYLPSFGANTELGNVNNFYDDLDELIDIVDDPTSTQDPASEVLNRFNTTLESLGESGYLKGSLSFGLPILPLVHNTNYHDSSIGISAGVLAQFGLQVLDSDLTFDDQNGTFSTATSLYLKSGLEKSITLSYSRPILDTPALDFARPGKLYGGMSARLISLELSKQVSPIQQLDGNDVSDIITDEYDSNLNETTNIAFSAGVVWDVGRYQVGFTLENINSPEFDYGPIGTDCANRTENTPSRSSCEAAARFIQQDGRIRARETHTMHARTRIDGLYHFTNKWSASGSIDLAAYDDIVGFENQWLHLATMYNFDNNILPALRVGLQSNLAGTQLSSLTVGMSLFKFATLDLEYGLNSTSIDGTSTPRRFGIALGVEERF